MKYLRSLIFLGLCVFGAVSVSSQSHNWCATDQSDAFMVDLQKNKKDWHKTVQKGAVERFIPVQFHLVADNDGSGRLGQKEVLNQLCLLNERFDSTEFRFYLADEMRDVNNTLVNSNPGAASSTLRNLKNPDAMNIFVLEDSGPGTAGFYQPGSSFDYIVIAKSQLTVQIDRFALEHEIGHFFTLPHTHRGWEADNYDPDVHGDTVMTTQVLQTQGLGAGTFIGVELVDGSNCNTAGDGICDTPPDYGFGDACNCCNMLWNVWDRNGDRIIPQLTNVMSYSEGCTWTFTEQQVTAMHTSYDANNRAYLRNGPVNEYTPISEPAELMLPQNIETIENYDGVLLTWSEVENAEEYIVTISGTVTTEFRTPFTEHYLTDLKPNGQYLWTVQPANKFGSGCYTTDARLFFTGSGTTSVDETDQINQLNIYPNPVRDGQILNIDFESEDSFEAQVNLYGTDGSLVRQINPVQIYSGSNSVKIGTESLTPGLYLLEIKNENGSKISRIFVE